MSAWVEEVLSEPGTDEEDHDSALGGSLHSETSTLSSSVCTYPVENGRTYHAYHDGAYLFPNDEWEQDRLELQYYMFSDLLGNKSYLSPIEQPCGVLDLGTGTGHWARDVADSQPQCQVVGVDLSPIQGGWTPPNCTFEVFDYDDPWTFTRKFDLICARMLIGSISSPRRLFGEAFEALTPGGWVEVQDVCPPTSMPRGSAFRHWRDEWCSALRQEGREPYLVKKLPSLLKRLGFENVAVQKLRLAQNGWPEDTSSKELGRKNTSPSSERIFEKRVNLVLQTACISYQVVPVVIDAFKIQKDALQWPWEPIGRVWVPNYTT